MIFSGNFLMLVTLIALLVEVKDLRRNMGLIVQGFKRIFRICISIYVNEYFKLSVIAK